MERTHQQQALYYRNSYKALCESVANSMGELIREYGKVNDKNPNVYEIETKSGLYDDDLYIGGKITLDVSYYEGTIMVQRFTNQDKNKFVDEVNFESLDIVRMMTIYHSLANEYGKK